MSRKPAANDKTMRRSDKAKKNFLLALSHRLSSRTNVIIFFDMEKFSIICPCCDATLTIDAQTGAVLAHEEKKKLHGSFEDLKGELNKQKELRDQLFSQEMSSQKDRKRILEEKFNEAMKRAGDEKDVPFRNPLDLD